MIMSVILAREAFANVRARKTQLEALAVVLLTVGLLAFAAIPVLLLLLATDNGFWVECFRVLLKNFLSLFDYFLFIVRSVAAACAPAI